MDLILCFQAWFHNKRRRTRLLAQECQRQGIPLPASLPRLQPVSPSQADGTARESGENLKEVVQLPEDDHNMHKMTSSPPHRLQITPCKTEPMQRLLANETQRDFADTRFPATEFVVCHPRERPDSPQPCDEHENPAPDHAPHPSQYLTYEAVSSDTTGLHPTSDPRIATVPRGLPSPLTVLSEVRLSLMSYDALRKYDCPVSPGQAVLAAQSLRQLASPAMPSSNFTSHPPSPRPTRGYLSHDAVVPYSTAVPTDVEQRLLALYTLAGRDSLLSFDTRTPEQPQTWLS